MFQECGNIYAYTSIIKAFARFNGRKKRKIIINIYANVLDKCLSIDYDEFEKWNHSMFCINV